MVDTFDTDFLIKQKSKAFKDWNQHNFIFRQSSEIVFKKLSEINQNFKNVLLITSDLSETIDKLSELNYEKIIYLTQYEKFLELTNFKCKSFSRVLSRFENIPFKEQSFDLIICNFCFHNINDKKNYLNKLFSILKNKGMLFCNFFGGNSLYELQKCFFLADEQIYGGSYLRFPPKIKMINFSDLLSQVGFKEIVSEKVNYEILYKNTTNMIKDLNGIGEGCILKTKQKGLLTKNYIKTLDSLYKREFSNSESNLKLTCDIISTTCWKNS